MCTQSLCLLLTWLYNFPLANLCIQYEHDNTIAIKSSLYKCYIEKCENILQFHTYWEMWLVSLKKCAYYLIWLAKVKCLHDEVATEMCTDVFSILGGVEGGTHFFHAFSNAQREQPVCFLIATCWHENTRSIKRRCSVSSKVETLGVCCESGTVTMTRSFELGTCLGHSK